MFGCTEHTQVFLITPSSTAFALHCALEMVLRIRDSVLDVNTNSFLGIQGQGARLIILASIKLPACAKPPPEAAKQDYRA